MIVLVYYKRVQKDQVLLLRVVALEQNKIMYYKLNPHHPATMHADLAIDESDGTS